MRSLTKDFIDLLERIVHDWRKMLPQLSETARVQAERNIADMVNLIEELREENK
jgi:hypothetical protein